jgi:glycosyltransferase involved in cell wall biosynthesis
VVHVVHAIHDFLPRHRAGSELYALALARAQLARHHVTVLCADYDPARAHGHVTWRVHEGVPVVEIVNNWHAERVADTYRPALIAERLSDLLRTLRPDVLHVHSLLNLSFDLPAIASRQGIPVVATLHDYTLVCASGGQRVHRRAGHVCHDIDPERCARCFRESPFHQQAAVGRVTTATTSSWLGRAALSVRRRLPGLAVRIAAAAQGLRGLPVDRAAMDERLAAAREVFAAVEVWVAPSAALAADFVRFGLPAERLRVSDYGMRPWPRAPRLAPASPLRLGFVGTPVWHKGVHVLIDAVRRLPAAGWRLDVFGDLDTFPDYVASLRTQSAGLPLTFHGGFAEGEASAVYERFDVLVVPSLWPENSPLVIHEAFQAGVAVVGSRIGGIPGLVVDGVNGRLFTPNSADELAGVLAELVAAPATVARLASAAPVVKDIADDAAEWEERYLEVAAMRTAAAVV